jgi:hypothetical protein
MLKHLKQLVFAAYTSDNLGFLVNEGKLTIEATKTR